MLVELLMQMMVGLLILVSSDPVTAILGGLVVAAATAHLVEEVLDFAPSVGHGFGGTESWKFIFRQRLLPHVRLGRGSRRMSGFPEL